MFEGLTFPSVHSMVSHAFRPSLPLPPPPSTLTYIPLYRTPSIVHPLRIAFSFSSVICEHHKPALSRQAIIIILNTMIRYYSTLDVTKSRRLLLLRDGGGQRLQIACLQDSKPCTHAPSNTFFKLRVLYVYSTLRRHLFGAKTITPTVTTVSRPSRTRVPGTNCAYKILSMHLKAIDHRVEQSWIKMIQNINSRTFNNNFYRAHGTVTVHRKVVDWTGRSRCRTLEPSMS